jgi:hypothetical protein
MQQKIANRLGPEKEKQLLMKSAFQQKLAVGPAKTQYANRRKVW